MMVIWVIRDLHFLSCFPGGPSPNEKFQPKQLSRFIFDSPCCYMSSTHETCYDVTTVYDLDSDY